MEEYLTTRQLSDRIKMAPGTIRNLIWQKKLKQNVHYVKPTGRKVLFVWSAIESWLYDKPVETFDGNNPQNRSLINI
jgi:hypothetical protein